jgi:hypothetical protein
MALFDQEESEEQESEAAESGNSIAYLIVLATLPVMIFFTLIGKTDLGVSAAFCLFMNILAVGMCWDLRRRWWFWAVVVLVLALHVPVILMIKWPHWWVSRFALLPIGLADMLVTVGVVRFVQKFIVKSPPPDEEA